MIGMIESFIQFGTGMILGVIPAVVWARKGGDENICMGKFTKYLKPIHHWHIGILIFIFGALLNQPFIMGWGVSTYLDDMLFHSYENYFKRKHNNHS